MSGGLLLQALVAGLAAGLLYGLVGAGYGLIYRMSGVLNFAHGELVSVALFVFLLAIGGGVQVAVTAAAPGGLVVAAALAVVVTVAVALALQRAAVAPFSRRGSVMGWIAATAAAGLLARSVIALVFPAEGYSLPDILPVAGLGRGGVVDLPGGGLLQVRDVVVLLVAAGVAVAFDRWLAVSRGGRAMRAAAESPEAARLVGISPERQALFAFAVAGLLAAVAALLLAPTRPVSLQLGVIIGLKGLAAAVLGGLGSARGAVLAGIAIGVGEALLGVSGLASLRDLAPLAVLVAVLALLPGRLGGREASAE